MPIVPKYENNVPGVVESGRGFGAPVDNVRPSFDYESVMNRALQPWSQLADSTIKIEAYHHDTVVKAQADEQLDAYNKEVQTTLYDPEKGYFAQRGKNAVTGWDQAQTDLQSIYDKHLSQIDDPDVKEAFKSNALQRLNSVRQKTVVYRNEQNIRWRAQTSKDHADNLVEEFALGGFSPDGQRTMASLMNEIEYQGRMQGWDEETLKRQKTAYQSLAYAGAYGNAMLTDPEGAMRHFQTTGQKIMTPDVSQRVLMELYKTSKPIMASKLAAMGGISALSLTSGAVARLHGDLDLGERVRNQQQAQQGLGTPPKVSDKVLNTSGYKCCNPLNVKVFGNKWNGLIGQDERGHGIFSRPEEGIRAGVKVLQSYSNKYGIKTIEGIISRFAAADPTTLRAYVDNVSHASGYAPDEQLDVTNPDVLRKIIPPMIRQEIGDVPYSERTIIAGIQGALGKEDINDFSDFYNTKLTDEEEAQYQAWAKKIGHERDVYDYDLRGAWKAGAAQAENGHFPDTFKKPNHHTFSEESQYADGKRNIGGRWVVENGQNIFIGPNGERRDDNGKLLSEGTAQAPRLTAADLILNPDVKTGYAVFDSLPRALKFDLLKSVKQKADQSISEQKGQLSLAIKNGLAQARNTGDIGGIPTETDFIQVYGQLEGTEKFRAVQQEAQFNANLYMMPGMSVADMESMYRQLTPEKGDPQYAERMKQRDLWQKAMNQTQKERAEDPVQFAFSGMPDLGLQQITDWTNQDGALLQIQKRIDSMDQVAERFGTPRTLFSKAEISGFLNFMQGMDADHQADFLNRMAERMTDPTATTSEPLRIFSEQIGNKNQTLAIALGVASTTNGKEMNGALRQINGDYIKKSKIGEAWKDEKEMRTLLSGVLAVSDGSPAYEAMLSAAMNEHCYANQSSSQDVSKSVENVFGKVYEHNGKKIFLPTQLDKAQKNTFTFRQVGSFEDLLSDAGMDLAKSKKSYFYGGQKLTPSQLENLVSAGQLQSIDDGVYQVVNGLNYVRDEQGQPLVIDLNTYISRRTKR